MDYTALITQHLPLPDFAVRRASDGRGQQRHKLLHRFDHFEKLSNLHRSFPAIHLSACMDILLIFLRNPVPGQVKTRLARTVGNAEALRIYLLLLERTRTAALGAAARRWLCYTDFADYDDAWPNAFFEKKVQHSGDLGQRMAAAFREAFEAGAERVVIIGSDCPQLDGAALQAAFEQLHQADFVLGPVPDGGYYLLGMKQYTPGVFEGIAWSTDTVRAETLHRIGQLGATCALLPMLADVDTEQDWLDWQACQ